jgi:hypothetical protein
VPPGFNPTRFAAKALAIGTVLCLSATGAVAFVVGRAMGVRDAYEFADVVRAWAPRKRRELEGWLGVKVRERVGGVLCEAGRFAFTHNTTQTNAAQRGAGGGAGGGGAHELRGGDGALGEGGAGGRG